MHAKRLTKGFSILLSALLMFITIFSSNTAFANILVNAEDPYSDEFWSEDFHVDLGNTTEFEDNWDYEKGDYIEGYFQDESLENKLTSQPDEIIALPIDPITNAQVLKDGIIEDEYNAQALPFLIPLLAPHVVRIGGQLLVRQYLKNTTKNIVIRNGHLANKVHPISRVPFNKNGFPIFNSSFNTQRMPMEMIKNSNSNHFNFANKQLKTAVTNNSTIRNRFSNSQLTTIRNGQTPSGFTWHHSENTGILQLVKTIPHKATGHTGGRAIWGTN